MAPASRGHEDLRYEGPPKDGWELLEQALIVLALGLASAFLGGLMLAIIVHAFLGAIG